MKFACSLLILFANFIEFLHVLKEVGSSLQSNEKLGLFAVAAVVGGLYCDGLCSNLLERGVVVPIITNQQSQRSSPHNNSKRDLDTLMVRSTIRSNRDVSSKPLPLKKQVRPHPVTQASFGSNLNMSAPILPLS